MIGSSIVYAARRRLAGYARRLIGEAAPQPRTKHLWSIGLYSGSSPLALAPDDAIPNPVLTRAHVTDVEASLVADPFLIRDGDDWHIFFEALDRRNGRGVIALATSGDLVHWNYRQVVLSEPFHLSYPHVFEWDGAWWMVPETHKTRSIRLYRATEFPLRWTLAHTLLSGERFADTTLFRHADRWWLFTETSPQMKHDTLRLYSADALTGPWTEHPASPIVAGDARSARPAGPVLTTNDGLVRVAQDCVPRYGMSVNAFEITTLTSDAYAERAVATNPVLRAGTEHWNSAGMHHLSAHEVTKGRWVAAVDGWYAATAAEVAGAR
jgi:beta-xylosidase